ncbi:Indoleamine 2,3-dioxygenase 2 [Desmophyllum pertusum]|uniref:Indoleamine 2,3-dioxygenase 2 n=1 Tax=Desmophyllum pertusum TaxID=174260 RepID=A0A9W9ZLC3_9CNID|nr:Indoleamine 2,3-dioxygenase 2 [Desmophyllum pertusum]
MTSGSESRQEAVATKLGALSTKTKTRIGFWKVRTMFSTGRLAQVTREMNEIKLHILGIKPLWRFDVSKLKDDALRNQFCMELRNGFQAFAEGDIERAEEDPLQAYSVQSEWDKIVKTYHSMF